MRCINVEKEHNFFTEHSTKCKCGHTLLITEKKGYKLCRFCKRYVFATKEIEIKYRNKEALMKYRREHDRH